MFVYFRFFHWVIYTVVILQEQSHEIIGYALGFIRRRRLFPRACQEDGSFFERFDKNSKERNTAQPTLLPFVKPLRYLQLLQRNGDCFLSLWSIRRGFPASPCSMEQFQSSTRASARLRLSHTVNHN